MDEVTGTERGRGWRTGGCGVPEATQGFWEEKKRQPVWQGEDVDQWTNELASMGAVVTLMKLCGWTRLKRGWREREGTAKAGTLF